MAKTNDEIRAEIQSDIDELEGIFQKYQEGGFHVMEIAKFVFEVGTRLVEAVQKVKDISGKQKKELVLTTVRDIYKRHDPNIPWLIEPFETMIENLILDKALSAFVDVMVDTLKKKGVLPAPAGS